MTTDQAFEKACELLDTAIGIWELKDKRNYAKASRCYDEAVRLRDEFFSDNKKVLTEDLCPF
jgi:hypothetical protein